MAHKRDSRVGPPIPRIRDDSRLMRMHESMVDYLTGRSSSVTFMHMLAPSFFGLNVFESFGDDLIYSGDEDDYQQSHLFNSLDPHPQIKQLTDEEEDSFIKEQRDDDIRRRTEKNKRKKMRKKAKKRLEKENALKDTSLEENADEEDSENQESLFTLNENSKAKVFPESQTTAEAAGIDDKDDDVRMKKKGNHLLKESQDLDFQGSAAPPEPTKSQKLPRDEGKGVEEQPKASHNHEEYLDVEDLWKLFAEASLEETTDQKTTKEEEEEDNTTQNKHTPVKKKQDSTVQAAVDRPAEEFAKRSVDLANAGNRLAASGQFELAVKCFTDAIRYNPMEFKLFGNRSLCFERLQQYGNALRDAELALSLQPNWIKGLFRKGKALCGLKVLNTRFMSSSRLRAGVVN